MTDQPTKMSIALMPCPSGCGGGIGAAEIDSMSFLVCGKCGMRGQISMIGQRYADILWDALPRRSDMRPAQPKAPIASETPALNERDKLRPCKFKFRRDDSFGEMILWERGWFHMLNSEGTPQVESERGELFSVSREYFRFTDRAIELTDADESKLRDALIRIRDLEKSEGSVHARDSVARTIATYALRGEDYEKYL